MTDLYRIELVRTPKTYQWTQPPVGGAWFWRIVARNGNTLAHSETYSSKTKAMWTASRVADDWGIEVEER